MGIVDRLERAKEALPDLLGKDAAWNDVDVRYHPPRVERLWLPFEDGRIFLHEIHPCEPSDALLHPHPWPSAMYLFDGEYEMGHATADPAGPRPANVGRRIVRAGETYAMERPDEWHYVAPVRSAVHSLMVIGPAWPHDGPRKHVTRGLSRIGEERRRELLALFRSFLPPA